MCKLFDDKATRTIFYPNRESLIGCWILVLLLVLLTYFTSDTLIEERFSTSNGRALFYIILSLLIFIVYTYLVSRIQIIIYWERKEVVKKSFRGYTLLANFSDVADIYKTTQYNLSSQFLVLKSDILGEGIRLTTSLRANGKSQAQVAEILDRLRSNLSVERSEVPSTLQLFSELTSKLFIFRTMNWHQSILGVFLFASSILLVYGLIFEDLQLKYILLCGFFGLGFLYLSISLLLNSKKMLQVDISERFIEIIPGFGFIHRRFTFDQIGYVLVEKHYGGDDLLNGIIMKSYQGLSVFLQLASPCKKVCLIILDKSQSNIGAQLISDLGLLVDKPIVVQDKYKKEPYPKA